MSGVSTPFAAVHRRSFRPSSSFWDFSPGEGCPDHEARVSAKMLEVDSRKPALKSLGELLLDGLSRPPDSIFAVSAELPGAHDPRGADGVLVDLMERRSGASPPFLLSPAAPVAAWSVGVLREEATAACAPASASAGWAPSSSATQPGDCFDGTRLCDGLGDAWRLPCGSGGNTEPQATIPGSSLELGETRSDEGPACRLFLPGLSEPH
mmetsp:Transcript_32405/g.91044  ORF Transcript_32405/g.91044 Transcript_32405/m.91044 type:complete len:209 (+) Transcript_32405:1306-1932(+)